MTEPARRPGLPYLLALFTVGILLAVSFDPAGRRWGFDAWAALPLAARLLLAVLVLGCGPLAARFARGSAPARSRRDLIADLGVVAGFGLLCALLRTETHYLGDGWQSLSLLAADVPRVKGTAPLPAWLLPRLKGLLGPDPDVAALAAYRTLAVSSGIVAASAVVVAARKMIDERTPRLLFSLGVLFGGASLVFFGYVENYAPLVAATTAFAVLGAAVAAGHQSFRLPAIVAAVLAMFSHFFGVALLPALVWLLLHRTRLGRRPGPVPLALGLTALALGLAAGAFVILRDLSLRLQFVPWVSGEFTLEGYTLLSATHILDLVNLLSVLVPAGLVLVGVALVSRDPGLLRDPSIRFLAVLAGSTFAVVALVDPKLGMARDQDLFSFAGPPVAVLLMLAWLRVQSRHASLRPLGLVAVVLSAAVLLPRVWTLRDDARALEPFQRALELDHARSRNSWALLVDRARRLGQEDLAEEEALRWLAAYPERQAVLEARVAEKTGDPATAIRLYERAIEINPQYMDPYNNLGAIYILARRDADALAPLEIARAISPNEPSVLQNLGSVYFRLGDLDHAEELFRRLHDLQPEGYASRRNLAWTARERGDPEEYRKWLTLALEEPDAPPEILVEYADLLMREGRRAEAVPILRRAIQEGLDERTARALREALPELRDVR